MTFPGEVLYAGYGENKAPEMIEAITGEQPRVVGPVLIQDVTLHLQAIGDVPTTRAPGASQSVKEILEAEWGANSKYRTLTAVEDPGEEAIATLFGITPRAFKFMKNWALEGFDWHTFKPVTCIPYTLDNTGKIVAADRSATRAAVTEFVGPRDQQLRQAVDGYNYPDHPGRVDVEALHDAAVRARQFVQ